MGALVVPGGNATVNLLAASAVPINAPNDLLLNTLVSVPIPGNTLGLNGILRITFQRSLTFIGFPGFLKLNFGGVTFSTQTVTKIGRIQREIANRGAANSQIAFIDTSVTGWGTVASPAVFFTAAIDTTVNQTVDFVAQKSNALDIIVLESFSIELLKP